MASKLFRWFGRMIGYVLAVIAMMGQAWVFLICVSVIFWGVPYVLDHLCGAGRMLA